MHRTELFIYNITYAMFSEINYFFCIHKKVLLFIYDSQAQAWKEPRDRLQPYRFTSFLETGPVPPGSL